jgi:hypothetical protein
VAKITFKNNKIFHTSGRMPGAECFPSPVSWLYLVVGVGVKGGKSGERQGVMYGMTRSSFGATF